MARPHKTKWQTVGSRPKLRALLSKLARRTERLWRGRRARRPVHFLHIGVKKTVFFPSSGLGKCLISNDLGGDGLKSANRGNTREHKKEHGGTQSAVFPLLGCPNQGDGNDRGNQQRQANPTKPIGQGEPSSFADLGKFILELVE